MLHTFKKSTIKSLLHSGLSCISFVIRFVTFGIVRTLPKKRRVGWSLFSRICYDWDLVSWGLVSINLK